MGGDYSGLSALRRFAREEQAKTGATEAVPQERCDLCGGVIPPEHRHLLEIATREIVCVCRPCSILFSAAARTR